MRVTCSYCEEKISVKPFIYSPRILTTERFVSAFEPPRYEARVNIKFTCVNCGAVNNQVVLNDIYETDIIKLAIGEGE